MMYRLTGFISISAIVMFAVMTLEQSAAFADEPSSNEFDEDSAMIRAIGMSRGVPHPEVSQYFRGSRYGGLLFVLNMPVTMKEIGVDDAVSMEVRRMIFPFRREKDQAAMKLAAANREFAEDGQNHDELKMHRIELLKQYFLEVQALEEKHLPVLKKLLTEEQFTRLQQIGMQAFGSWDLAADPELAKALELTPEQIAKIAAINGEYWRKELEIYAKGPRMPNYKRLELGKERDSKAIECLSQEQQENYKQILGKPFKLALLSIPEAWRATTESPGLGRQAPALLSTVENTGIINLVSNPLVQKELGLSDDANAKAGAVKEQFAAAWEEAGGRARAGMRVLPDGKTVRFRDAIPPGTFILLGRDQSDDEFKQELEKQRELWNTLTAKYLLQFKEILSADQFTRLQQIHWQFCGVEAFSDPEIIQLLSVTQEQQEKIRAEMDEYRIHQRTFSGQRVVESTREKLAESLKQRDTKITQLMTKQQLDQFATMKGKPFHFPLAGAVAPARLFTPGLRGGIFSIVRNESVQQELGMSQDTEINVEFVKERFNDAWHEAGGGYRIRNVTRKSGGMVTFQEAAMPPWGLRMEPNLTAEERNEKIEKMTDQWRSINEKYQAELKTVLTPEQYTRLKQITWQAMGTLSYSDPEVIAELAMTKEQQDKLAVVNDEFRQRHQQLIAQGAGDGGGPAERNEKLKELGEKLKELAKEQEVKINAVLTQFQLEQFTALKGKGFDVSQLLESDQPNGPGRGPAAGGRGLPASQ